MNISKNFSLKNKIAIITGGNGLLGSTYSYGLHEAGAKIIVLDKKINKNKFFNFIKKEFNADLTDSQNIQFIECDITNKKSVDNSFKKISFDLNKLEILINNASLVKQIGTDKLDSTYIPFLKMKKEEWEEYFSVDLTGTLHLCQKVIPYMQKNSGGSIINISSTYGILSPDQRIYSSLSEKNSEDIEKPIGYSVSKSGILNLTRFLATKFASQNIRVNTLTLGGVYANNPKQFVKEYSSKTPLGRMADKSEYIGPMIFLASNASSYMTGSNLIVDGGWSAW